MAVGQTSSSTRDACTLAESAKIVVGSESGIVEIASWALTGALVVRSIQEVRQGTFRAVDGAGNT